MTLAGVAAACDGRLENAPEEASISGVVIDSRAAKDGDLFVALPGDHADGHAFAADAVRRGAVAILARHGGDVGTLPAVRVEDPAAALGRIAAHVRGRTPARVVGITGSSGKTTTKQLTAAAIGARFRVAAAEASFNNELGVPLTICSIEPGTEVLVAEVGSRGRGHIAALMPMLRPDVAVVTNIGAAHFEMFGSLDETARAKGELVEAIGSGGAAVLNADDARVAALASKTTGRVMTFGTAADATVRAENVTLDERACARFEVVSGSARAKVSLEMPGEHMVSNALAALAVAGALGVDLESAAAALATVAPVAWRMQISDAPGGITVVNDAYNANPSSAAAALRALATIGAGRRTWAVLGEMAELGPIAGEEHDRLGRLAARIGISRVLAVGEPARAAAQAARLECMTPEEATWVADADEAISFLRENLRSGDVVLLKGSRVAALERVAAALLGGGE